MEAPKIKLDRFPLSLQSFEDIRKRNYIYVDKTDYVYRLVNQGKTYFLARPRRFDWGRKRDFQNRRKFFERGKEYCRLEGGGIRNCANIRQLSFICAFLSARKLLSRQMRVKVWNWESLSFSDSLFLLFSQNCCRRLRRFSLCIFFSFAEKQNSSWKCNIFSKIRIHFQKGL